MPNFSMLMLLIPPILAALTVHEYAHGWTAYQLGDPTAKMQGRLTLNPLAHLDPIGTILLFVAFFGWAKPVPVNPNNFRRPQRDMIWVALAGPGANVVLAALLGSLLQLLLQYQLIDAFGAAYQMLTLGVFINLMLAFFNLLPIPPLDGSKVVSGLLPARYLVWWMSFERIGPLILLGVIIFARFANVPIFGSTIYPLALSLYRIFTGGAPLMN
jgi:Zn-dependent protease